MMCVDYLIFFITRSANIYLSIECVGPSCSLESLSFSIECVDLSCSLESRSFSIECVDPSCSLESHSFSITSALPWDFQAGLLLILPNCILDQLGYSSIFVLLSPLFCLSLPFVLIFCKIFSHLS